MSRGEAPRRRRKSRPGVCDVCGCAVVAEAGHAYRDGRLNAVRCVKHVEGLGGCDYSGNLWDVGWCYSTAMQAFYGEGFPLGITYEERDRRERMFAADVGPQARAS